MNFSAGIVLFNPDIKTLNESIKELHSVTQNIILVDNNSDNIIEIKELIQAYNNIVLIENENNLGIARALNQLLEEAYNTKSEYLLTLDQDSIISKNDVIKMLEYKDIENVAVICPVINDLNKSKKLIQEQEYIEIDRCITSGSLMNLKKCKNLGKFDEKMFIDYVDFEYCKRIILKGYKIIRVRDAVINHEIGKRTKRKFLFWTVFPTNHNYKRTFYYVRNIRYYLKKYKKNMTVKEKIVEYKYLLWRLVTIIFYEKNKKIKLRSYFDGFMMKESCYEKYKI